MKTIVVAFDGLNSINNFTALDSLADDGYRIITHTSPEFHVNSSGFYRNYDILITSNVKSGIITDVDIARTVYMPRYPKPHMTARINEHCVKNQYSHHIPVWSWSSDVAMQKDRNATHHISEYVVKLSNGARGIGQFHIKPKTKCTPRHIFESFNRLIKQASVQLSTLDKSLTADVIWTLIKEVGVKIFPDDTVYFSGLEDKDVEYVVSALNNIGDWHLETFVPDIDAEYRIIKAHGANIICKRQFKEDRGYQQATGKFVVSEDKLTRIPELCDNAWSELCDLIEGVVPDNNSIDVFVKKHCNGIDTYGFGVFEYSNQFGFMGIPIAEVLNAQRVFVIAKYIELTANDN